MLVLGAAIAFSYATARLYPSFDGADDGELAERADGWFLTSLDDTVLVDVDRVIDGDTLDVLTAGRETLRVRVFGIDAPERGARCYDEATFALEVSAGDAVRLLPDERLEDQGGRQLRYLFTPEGRSIDATLVSSGLVEAWSPDGAFRDVLVELEEEADRANRGCLWEDE